MILPNNHNLAWATNTSPAISTWLGPTNKYCTRAGSQLGMGRPANTGPGLDLNLAWADQQILAQGRISTWHGPTSKYWPRAGSQLGMGRPANTGPGPGLNLAWADQQIYPRDLNLAWADQQVRCLISRSG